MAEKIKPLNQDLRKKLRVTAKNGVLTKNQRTMLNTWLINVSARHMNNTQVAKVIGKTRAGLAKLIQRGQGNPLGELTLNELDALIPAYNEDVTKPVEKKIPANAGTVASMTDAEKKALKKAIGGK